MSEKIYLFFGANLQCSFPRGNTGPIHFRRIYIVMPPSRSLAAANRRDDDDNQRGYRLG